jgi:transcription elongation GreA/GreB family factor
MSRAFVKENDMEDTADLPERPPCPSPNYLTPQGFRKLHAELTDMRAQREALLQVKDTDMAAESQLHRIERDLRYLEQCAQNAVMVESAGQARPDVRFGASVKVIDEDGETHVFTIVGEQESCAPKGWISWISPLAKSLLGHAVGDVVIWERPAGNVELEIQDVSYPEIS